MSFYSGTYVTTVRHGHSMVNSVRKNLGQTNKQTDKNEMTIVAMRLCQGPREFNRFLQTQLRWNQRKPVKSNGLSRVLMLN